MDNDILNLIMPELIARAGRLYTENEEYKEAVRKADLIFEEISDSLDDELSEKLENYFTANNATIAIMEKLIYQQGMQDLLNLFIDILRRNEHVNI